MAAANRTAYLHTLIIFWLANHITEKEWVLGDLKRAHSDRPRFPVRNEAHENLLAEWVSSVLTVK